MGSLAIALETIGVVAIIAGIAIESIMKANIGFIVITGGSVAVAAGSLVWAKLIKRK